MLQREFGFGLRLDYGLGFSPETPDIRLRQDPQLRVSHLATTITQDRFFVPAQKAIRCSVNKTQHKLFTVESIWAAVFEIAAFSFSYFRKDSAIPFTRQFN